MEYQRAVGGTREFYRYGDWDYLNTIKRIGGNNTRNSVGELVMSRLLLEP